MNQKRVLLLGATGSIGDSTIAVVENLPDELALAGLAAHRSWEKLIPSVERHRPAAVAMSDAGAADQLERALAARLDPGARPRIYRGPDGLVDLVRETDADIVLGAISGAAGLPTSVAALESGKDLALANKESLVTSGALLTRIARTTGRRILPVDSEHSAIFQSLLAGKPAEVESIILTASGGPFRETPAEKLRTVTKAEALRHPTWEMGAKITIDSATLMNKALEVIEARWLFDLEPDAIRVVIHPQSIIHSIVEYCDGSMVCQLGLPDMKIPIQYALTYPERRPLPVERLSLSKQRELTFFEPDVERFPALALAYEVLRDGGTAATVFNAANEVAVDAFLAERISFPDIGTTIQSTLRTHRDRGEPAEDVPDLDAILAADRWARAEATRQLTANEAPSR